MPATADADKSVAPCYLFKSQLQQFVQKVGYPTPSYESVKEGPSHRPTFRATVTVNNVTYDSLPGFFTRKAAEQSAAEAALALLVKSQSTSECNAKPVTETGLCKNFLQEYAQKMNYCMPVYRFEKATKDGRTQSVIYSVEVNGIKYIGGAAKNRKEAEIKAARTALLAIEGSTSPSHSPQVDPEHSVVPLIKRAVDVEPNPQETTDALKVKRKRLKKKPRKRKKMSETNLLDVEGEDKTSPMVHCSDDMAGVDDSLIKLSDPNVSCEHGKCLTPSGDDSVQNLSYLDGKQNGESKDSIIPMVEGKHSSESNDHSIPMFDSFMKLFDSRVLHGEMSSPDWAESLTPLGAGSIPMADDRVTEKSDHRVSNGKLSTPEWAECLTSLGSCTTGNPNFSHLESLRHREETVNMMRSHFGNDRMLPAYRCDGLDSLIEIANGGPSPSHES